MSSKTTGEMYDEIVLKGTGQYMGSLRNPVSKLRSGPQGRRYNAIYVVNPIEGGEISRVLVSHEDLPQVLKLRSIFIQDNGEVMGKIREPERFHAQVHHLFDLAKPAGTHQRQRLGFPT